MSWELPDDGLLGIRRGTLLCVLALAILLPAAAAAQAPDPTPVRAPAMTVVPGLPFPIFGPAPPVAPATAARDAAGRLTIRAVRLPSPVRVDGNLDEPFYATVPPVTDFIQIDPALGEPASQKTEFWIFFDDDNLYAVAKLYESNLTGMIANEMRRDNIALTQNEYINFVFDTFYDRRNAQVFVVAPTGGRMDGQLTNERQYNGDWNPAWNVKTGRFDGGWTVESAIPFKSLRYRPGRTQVWGLHVSRYNRWKNEMSFPLLMSQARGTGGSFQVSMAPTLVGIEAPPPARNLELKPYAISSVTSDRATTPAVSNDVSGDVGVDLKYGITQGLTADLTYNTDFAQVEADEQQINLTRFSLFFPEKRDFFLENQGTFAFGGAGATSGGDTPVMFYSRRIGLSGSGIVPIHGGGRLTGRAGRFSIGAIDIQSKGESSSGTRSTNFSVVRLKRDVLRRSSVGGLFTGRSVAANGIGTNQTYGVDGAFAFYEDLSFNTYWARTQTDGRSGDDTSYRAQLDYAADRYGFQAEHLDVGANFNPEVGFVRRSDIQKSYGLVRFSPRTDRFQTVRRFFAQGSSEYIQNGAGRVELRDTRAEIAVEYQNSDRLAFNYSGVYEYIPVPFRIAPGVTVPVGGYDYDNAKVSFKLGQQRRLSGTISAEYGTLYGGHKTAVGFSQGRINVLTQLSVEPTLSINHVEIGEHAFNTNLVGSRITYTMTPLMFVSALLQYNSSSHRLATNVRLRWEYQPGSELFAVYHDQRDTLPGGVPTLTNRAFILKINKLFRF